MHQFDASIKNQKNSDGLVWRCQKNNHSTEKSIRKGSWFENSNLTIEEVIELTYWWSTGECLILRKLKKVTKMRVYKKKGRPLKRI